MMNIRFKLLDIKCYPEKANAFDVGYDLKSRHETITILPDMEVKIPTGIIVDFPQTVWGMLAPRSGLGTKYGLRLLNTVGIIDPGYRGEIMAIVTASKKITIEKYSRFAQILFLPYIPTNLIPSADIGITDRGEKGFGDSGV